MPVAFNDELNKQQITKQIHKSTLLLISDAARILIPHSN